MSNHPLNTLSYQKATRAWSRDVRIEWDKDKNFKGGLKYKDLESEYREQVDAV